MKKIFLSLLIFSIAAFSVSCGKNSADNQAESDDTDSIQSLSYFEKSKVSKDIITLDGVRLTVEAEITDEQLHALSTDNPETPKVIEGVMLIDIKNADENSKYYLLSQRLFGENKGIEEVLTTDEAFSSQTAKGAEIKVFLGGDGSVAAAAVKDDKVVNYNGKDLLVSTKFSYDDCEKLDFSNDSYTESSSSYFEKSKVGKDVNTLDAVRLTVEAEITDEQLYTLSTDNPETPNVIEGVMLIDIKNADENSKYYLLSQRLFGGYAAIEDILTTDEAFSSQTAKGAVIKVFLGGDGEVAVAAVKDGKVVNYNGKDLLVSTKFSESELNKLDFGI